MQMKYSTINAVIIFLEKIWKGKESYATNYVFSARQRTAAFHVQAFIHLFNTVCVYQMQHFTTILFTNSCLSEDDDNDSDNDPPAKFTTRLWLQHLANHKPCWQGLQCLSSLDMTSLNL